MRPIDPRLLREAPPARRFLIAAFALALVAAAALLVQAVALGRLVADVFLHGRALGDVTGLLVALAAAAAIRAVVAFVLESGGSLAAVLTGRALRRKLLAHLLTARPGGVRDRPAGELAAAAVSGLDDLQPYFARFLPQLVLAAIVPAAIFAWTLLHDLTSAIVMAVTLPLIPIFGILIGKVTEERTLRRFETLSTLSAHFLDVVRGLPTLRAFRRSRVQSETIAHVSDAYRRETMGTLRIAFLSALVLELAATLGTAVIAVEIGVRLVDGGIALAPALAVLVLAPEYYGPLREAAAQFHASTDGLAAAQRVFELLDLPPTVAAPERPAPVPDLRVTPLRLERIGLTYPGRDEPALAGVTLELSPGERIALAGPSGAGKTSLLGLLLRLQDPSTGGIVAGGVELAQLDPAAWRRELAWLPQRPHLHGATLREALAAGSAATDDQLWEALAAAAAAPVVTALPLGLGTPLGELPPFSAGELRRLALARALARRAPLLLLDEPTAHLDPVAASAVTDAVAALPREGIVLVATHDERLARALDRIVELRDGRLAGRAVEVVA